MLTVYARPPGTRHPESNRIVLEFLLVLRKLNIKYCQNKFFLSHDGTFLATIDEAEAVL